MGELTKIVVVVPTYNERDNLPGWSELAGRCSCPTCMCWSSTTTPPMAPATSPTSWPPSSGGTVGVLHRTAKDGLGRAYVAGMTRALDEGADIVIQMDADLSHPAVGDPDHGRDAADDRRRGGHRLPVRPRRLDRRGMAVAPQGAVRLGELLRQRDPAVARQGRHRRLQGLAGRRPAGDRRRVGPEQRVLVPGRDELPGGASAG